MPTAVPGVTRSIGGFGMYWYRRYLWKKKITVYFEVNSLKHGYVPVNSKSAHSHWAYPGHLTRVLLRTVGNLIQNEALLVGHLIFVSKRWSALHAKGFRNFFRIQHVHRVHESLLLYSLFCWSF